MNATLIKKLVGSALNLSRSSHVDYANVSLRARIGRHVTVLGGSSIDFNTAIGSYTYIGWRTSVTRASIGRFCSIANNVSIGPGEHSPERLSTSSLFSAHQFDELTKKPCTLGSDVWVGVNSVIRRGVTVGNGAVIGANSFVNRDVPSFAITAGSPAHILRFRFTEEQRRRLEESAWWNLELDDARETLAKLEAEFGFGKTGG
jgi:acetyltransferase-like isoleucine patch superfamily enzyme